MADTKEPSAKSTGIIETDVKFVYETVFRVRQYDIPKTLTKYGNKGWLFCGMAPDPEEICTFIMVFTIGGQDAG